MVNWEEKLNKGLLKIKPYEPGKTIIEAKTELNLNSFVKLASNENPLGMSPKALEAIRQRVAEAFAYPEVSCRELRLALAKKFNLSADQFIIANGGDGVIYTLALSLLNDGDEAIIPEITFPYYEIAVNSMRAKVINSRMQGYEISLSDILAKINKHTKMIWLCNPNNPTGSLIKNDDFMAFMEKVPKDVLVIHDEVYADFADQTLFPQTLKLLREGIENLFLIRSFSKIYGLAGVRVGFGIGCPQLINYMYRVRPPFEVSVLAQLAALAALEDDSFYQQTLSLNQTEKKFNEAELAKRGLKYSPSHTNFILFDTGGDASFLSERLLAKGVIVRGGKNYKLPTHLRVTIGSHEQNLQFWRAWDEVWPNV